MILRSVSRRMIPLAGAAFAIAALLSSLACGQLLFLNEGDCTIGSIVASRTASENRYTYSVACSGAASLSGNVSASYNVSTTTAEERISGAQGVVTAVWTCTRDPWIRASDDEFTCPQRSRQASLSVPDRDLQALLTSRPTRYPYSAFSLDDAARSMLRARLTMPTPTPTLTPTPVARMAPPDTSVLVASPPPVARMAPPDVSVLTAPVPAAPANLWGEATISKTRIALGWGDVAGETRYELRAQNDDSGLFYTKTLPADAAYYVDDIGLNQTGAFAYELKACNANGCGTPAVVTVQLVGAPPPAE